MEEIVAFEALLLTYKTKFDAFKLFMEYSLQLSAFVIS